MHSPAESSFLVELSGHAKSLNCSVPVRTIVSYFSQSLAMASEGICHAPRGERLIHVA